MARDVDLRGTAHRVVRARLGDARLFLPRGRPPFGHGGLADHDRRRCSLGDQVAYHSRGARPLANETLRLGPPEPDQAAIRARRYALTDLATALDGSHETHIRIAAGLRFTLRLPTSPCAQRTDGAPPARRFRGLSRQWTRISPYGSRRHLRHCSPPAMSLPCRRWSISFSHPTEGDCAKGFINGHRPSGELPPSRCGDASARRLRLNSAPLLWIGNVAALQAPELS